jgi:DNA polymerase
MTDSLHLDFETYSASPLKVVGAYRYARDPTTEVLIACYAFSSDTVRTWLPFKQPIPPDLLNAARSDTIFKAHNADFEYSIWNYALRRQYPRLPTIAPSRWRCTAVRAAAAGLPRGLEDALVALQHQQRKDPAGKRLVRLFCVPRKPTKRNASVRIRPEDDPTAFAKFIAYCRQDVRAERGLDQKLPNLREQEWADYAYTIKVNERGVPLDIPSIEQTAKVIAKLEHTNHARVAVLTNGLKPTQRDKMLEWLKGNGGSIKDMKLATIEEALKTELPVDVREVLELRLEASKASTKKIKSMGAVACIDHRARGTMMYYGAHTGRFSGKLIQPHNFTRGLLTPTAQDNVLTVFRSGDHELVRVLYEQPMHMLSQSMRGFICAPDGSRFIIADYSMIETRILAWLAHEVKLLAIMHRNLTLPKEKQIDVYKLMAMLLYHVEYADVTKEQRRIGKNLRLGAGYQLGTDGLLKNCEKEGIEMEREFAQEAIRAYRTDNPNIVQLWYACEDAAIDAVDGKPRTVNQVHFEKWRDWLTITLPSGRKLWYFEPALNTIVKFKRPKVAVSYYQKDKKGFTDSSKGNAKESHYVNRKDATHVYTYGGKWVENIVQGIAYDIMINGMRAAEQRGYPSILSVHDEAISIRKHGDGTIKEFEEAICTAPSWAKGLPLVAEGFETVRYRKG